MNELTHKYLRPADLRRLRYVRFAARRPIEGRYAGRHASPQRGQSVEFNDYRPYMPGDELTAIDWKVYGRSDRLVVKRFEHQTDLSVHLLVDASASMAYRGDGPTRTLSKYDQAAHLAAAIAFLLTRQQDKVAFGIARHGLRHYHPPAGALTHVMNILTALEKTQLGERADLPDAIARVTALSPRRGLLVVFSDLLDDRDESLRALSAFTARGGEVIVFHVLHPDELSLPDDNAAIFIDAETDQRLTLNLDDLRDAYQQRMRAFLDAWSAALIGRGIDYNLVSTAADYHAALEQYLFKRAART
ncbi:MAG: DUF58 domain-containing protein [Planctomycetes bacterium]|nr:DUF58 domain-containing protein [Planctomycetota bacterium]